jgi:hypothetical protein
MKFPENRICTWRTLWVRILFSEGAGVLLARNYLFLKPSLSPHIVPPGHDGIAGYISVILSSLPQQFVMCALFGDAPVLDRKDSI